MKVLLDKGFEIARNCCAGQIAVTNTCMKLPIVFAYYFYYIKEVYSPVF